MQAEGWHHLPPGAAEWLRTGTLCPAALFVVQVMTGIPLLNRNLYPEPQPHPVNAYELLVVEWLLEAVPEFRKRMATEMGRASPAWRELVMHWGALLAHLQKEVADGNQLAPLTTRRIIALVG